MEPAQNTHAVVPRLVLEFLRKTLPFGELDKTSLENLARRCILEFYPKGSIIFKQDVTDITHVHIIQKGGIKAFLSSDETVVNLLAYGGEGESLGALPIVRGQKADFTVEALEDTFCLLIEKDVFLELFNECPAFAQHYLERLSEDSMYAVYSELRCEKVRYREEDAFYLFNSQVRDLIKGRPEVIRSSATVLQAGRLMAKHCIGALLVEDGHGSIVGIVTDKDLRTRVVAKGLDYESAVDRIMSSPVQGIPAQASCFDALVMMMKEKVGHLAVEHRKKIIGIVEARDITIYQGASPLYLFREIGDQTRVEGVCNASRKIPMVVRTLVEEGARAENITKMVTLFGNNIYRRLLALVTEELGPAPVPYSWLTLGSEGRKELTFRTDQCNALVYADHQDAQDQSHAEEYFLRLADRVIGHLEACGYSRCRNKIMASNPMWCRPYSVWRNYFVEWLHEPMLPDLEAVCVFLDFRPVFGDRGLGRGLRDHVMDLVRQRPQLLHLLAAQLVAERPPLSFFRDHVVERDGGQRETLDLKKRVLGPFVAFARLLALQHGIKETNTLTRLRDLADYGHIPRDLYADLREAHEFHVQLHIVTQLRMVESGLEPRHIVRPAELSDLEKRTLKESFAVMEHMLNHVQQVFGL